jgi:hypothetical protein
VLNELISDFDELLDKPEFRLVTASVADPDPVGSGPFWSDPDQDPGLKK